MSWYDDEDALAEANDETEDEMDGLYERGTGTTTAEKVDEKFPDKFDN